MHPFQYLDHRLAPSQPDHVLRTIGDCRSMAALTLAAQDWHQHGLTMAAHARLAREAGLSSPRVLTTLRQVVGEALVRFGQRLQTGGRSDVLTEAAGDSGGG